MRKNVVRLVLAGAALIVPTYAQTVTVTPPAVAVHVGTFYQLSARVTGVTPATVKWSVAVAGGGTGSPGTISTGGRYTPPPAIPSGGTVIVTATSVAAPAVFSNCIITLQNPYPTLASAKPSTISQGAFTLMLNGS